MAFPHSTSACTCTSNRGRQNQPRSPATEHLLVACLMHVYLQERCLLHACAPAAEVPASCRCISSRGCQLQTTLFLHSTSPGHANSACAGEELTWCSSSNVYFVVANTGLRAAAGYSVLLQGRAQRGARPNLASCMERIWLHQQVLMLQEKSGKV